MDICDGARKVAMGTIHRLETGTAVPTLGQACEAFLAGIANPNTARSYATALGALADWLGAHQPLSVLEGERIPDRAASWFTATWGTAAPATFNARLNALAAAENWWREQGWLNGDPLLRLSSTPVPAGKGRDLEGSSV